MSDNELPNVSVGDFAMDIMRSMASNPNSLKPALKESTLQSINAPDISHVKVSDDFVSLVTEGRKPISKPQKIKEESKNDKLESLVNRLSSLLVEARQIMEEISPGATTTGNIGSGKSKGKNNPWAICHSSTGPKKSKKFEDCVLKVKSKLK